MTKKTHLKLTSFLLCLLMLLAAFTPAVAALDNIDASIGIGGGHMAWVSEASAKKIMGFILFAN